MTSPATCDVNAECICGGNLNVPCYGTPPDTGVLEARVTGLAHGNVVGTVTRVVGSGGGHAVNESVEFFMVYGATVKTGDTIVAPLGNVYSPFGVCPIGMDGGPAPLGAVPFNTGGEYQCSAGLTPHPPAIGESDFIAAVMSRNCVASLTAIDPAWGERDCDGAGSGTTGTGKGMCALGGGGGGGGMLVVLVAALVAIRMTRRA